jgi:hypothetical protein
VQHNRTTARKIMNGYGVNLLLDGRREEGTFVNGKLHGPGTVRNPDESTLIGTFSGGRIMDGSGTSIYNGSIEEGTWVDGKMAGPGRKSLCNGLTLSGDFENDVLKRGVVTRKDGLMVRGEFETGDWRHCKGVRTLSSGVVEEGQWKTGLLYGRCKRTLPDGTVQEGEFQRNKLHGPGVVRSPDGAVLLEGEFKDGELLDGTGKRASDTAVQEGRWVDGKLKGTVTQAAPGEAQEGMVSKSLRHATKPAAPRTG